MLAIALFGAGRIGRIHAQNVVAHPALRLKYIVDPQAPDLAGYATQLGASAVDTKTVWADPQIAGVIIASPTHLHLDQTQAALAAGKAVLCEKPIDLDVQRVRDARPSLTGTDVPLLLGFNRRFDPNFMALKQRLDNAAVGVLETLQITSHDPAPPPATYVRTSGGLFKDMAIHDFDMARWLLGEEPVEVYAAASCLIDPAIAAEGDIDTAKTILKTASGKLCVISNSRRSGYGYDQRIEAYGSRGLVRADNVLESTVSVWGESGPSGDSFQNFFLERYAESYRRELAHFAAILAGKARPAIGYADAHAALELAEAAGKSARSGQPIRLS